MKDSQGLHLKTYFFLLFIALFAPLGNVLLSKGMRGIGSAKDWEHFVCHCRYSWAVAPR